MTTSHNIPLAVLPFKNMSSNQEMEYFSDGITEEIINALSRVEELRVSSRTSSFAFKRSEVTIPEIAKTLGVSVIVEGSIRLSGTFARISMQLIDVREDYLFWSQKIDRDLSDIFAVQDEIALLITDQLREHIGHFEVRDQLVSKQNISFESYKKYLKGRSLLFKLDYVNTLKAITIFEQVIEEAPHFPQAYLDTNQAYVYLATMGLTSPYEAYTKAAPFLEKAIALNPNLPETQLNLAWIHFWQKWNFQQGYKHLNKALSIQEKDDMYLTQANFQTIEGKLEQAHKSVDQALALDPLSPMNVHYKGFLYYLGEEYEKAMPYHKKSLELQTDLPFSYLCIGLNYLLRGDYQKGLSYFESLPPDSNGFLNRLGGCTLAYAMMEDLDKVEQGVEELKKHLETESFGNALNFLIFTLAQLGELEQAMYYVQLGIEKHTPILLLLPQEPLAKPLHEYPPFQKIFRQLIPKIEVTSKKKKYQKVLFEKEDLLRFKNNLIKLMKEEELFRDQELTLRKLAPYLNFSANQLSRLLNEGFGQNFSDYINTHRLNAFKEKLQKGEAHHLTLLALAYDSGFNSKTVFNTFFKKKMGQTPRAYFKSLAN